MLAQWFICWSWADTTFPHAFIKMSGNEKFLLVVAMRYFPCGLLTE